MSARLHTPGLAYQVVICFVIMLTISWEWYGEHGDLPPLA